MPTKSCSNDQQKIIAQTLFLGASVASFNNSVGWGSSPSQLTVNLVDDSPVVGSAAAGSCGGGFAKMYPDLPTGHGFENPNHYHSIPSSGIYVALKPNGTAEPYDPGKHDVSERMVAGKVYYKLDDSLLNFYSKYWLYSDPGFFGESTKLRTDFDDNTIANGIPVNPDGSLNPYGQPGFLTKANKYIKYDIIDTPVYFKMGDFSFGGLVQSWQTSLSNSGKGYTITINSMQSLLNSCYVILDKFAGSMFTQKQSSTSTGASIYGGSPKNYIGANAGYTNYFGTISEGNIPNVFNVYGFLESCGVDNFEVARRNDRGISVNKVIDALSVLTSAIKDANDNGFLYQNLNNTQQNTSVPFTNYANKHIFSPYGRIIAKHMQVDRSNEATNSASCPIGTRPYDGISSTFNSFGVIPPTQTLFDINQSKCQFALDLSDIPPLPDSFRVTEPVMSIMSLLTLIGEQIGHDIFIEAGPVYYPNCAVPQYINVIKVRLISRLSQPRTNLIENTVNELACNNYGISNYTLGKERNESPNRSMIVGANQQRLFQAKSYRLGFTQTNFVLNPNNGNMVNYQRLGYIKGNQSTGAYEVVNVNSSKYYHHGKIKFPNFLTTRNPKLVPYYGSDLEGSGYIPTGLIAEEQDLVGNSTINGFSGYDLYWDDTSVTTPSRNTNASRPIGNYLQSYTIEQSGLMDSDPPAPTNPRWQDNPDWGTKANQRWHPLYADVICPFFGYVQDEELTIKPMSNNEFRRVRPVWFDTWTGQSCVIVKMFELPELSVELSSGYYVTTNEFCKDSTTTTTSRPFAPTSTTASSGQRTGSGSTTNPNPAANSPVLEKTVCYNEFGQPTNYSISYIVISESEIRAALAGFDNFLVYELAKYYKPDLIEALRLSYFKKIRDKMLALGHTTQEANQGARSKTNWYWNINSSNIADDELKPGFMAPDRNQGSSYIPEDALKDLQILHKFVASIGKYYGKKYMVTAPDLSSYQDEEADIILPTEGGNAYIFRGDGKFYYNYEPTNEGAWEEYGNFIDDTIVVGSTSWYALSDEVGKIKPILGYNASQYFDYMRYNMCQLSQNQIDYVRRQDRVNPMWDWEGYLSLMEKSNINCSHEDYIFPSLDYSTLESDQYVVENVYERLGTVSAMQFMADSLVRVNPPTKVSAYDAFGQKIISSGSAALNKTITAPAINVSKPEYVAYKQKLYVNTTVEEKFAYLDPDNLASPKFLIDSPGIYLNHSSSEYAQDPNRTVMANVTIEDLLVYMRVTPPNQRDNDWMRYMLSYTMPINKFDEAATIDALGTYGSSNNQSALRVEIAPKAAHPFFAGIPIKSNQFCYGPWINNPFAEYSAFPDTLFPSGAYLSCSNGIISTGDLYIWPSQARSGCDNWVGVTEVEVMEEMAPWTYGGASLLDSAAYRYIATKVNYQSIIETAQVEMPGLPIFSLGGVFNINNAGIGTVGSYKCAGLDYLYNDVKTVTKGIFSMSGNMPTMPIVPQNTITTNQSKFRILKAISSQIVNQGPIITNIQTSVGQGGITTTYSFRTYSRKMGLFNKEQNDIIKKNNLERFKRNKEMSDIKREAKNNIVQQRDFMDKQRLESSINFNTETFKSKLFGTSPSTVLIGRSMPFIEEPKRTPQIIVDYTKYTTPGDLSTTPGNPIAWSGVKGNSPGYKERITKTPDNDATAKAEAINKLNLQGRYKTSVGLYERKEADSELDKQFGLNASMSLDGLLSPISFYPTFKNSTFAYSIYDVRTCPFCFGTKKRPVTYSQYKNDPPANNATDSNAGKKKIFVDNSGKPLYIYCDKCSTLNDKLNATLIEKKAKKNLEKIPPYIISSGTDLNNLLKLGKGGLSLSSKVAPINLITLNPVVVGRGEFRNSNSQYYDGAHPNGDHDDITAESPGFLSSEGERPFYDRQQHSIEIVGRGAIPPGSYEYSLETSQNFTKFLKHPPGVEANNLDYYHKDVMLNHYVSKLQPALSGIIPEMNYRFLGLRGPLNMHGWGYDTEGYPVPNAADEPFAIDEYGRPKRFKQKTINLGQCKFTDLSEGDSFTITNNLGTDPDEPVGRIYTKTFNKELTPDGYIVGTTPYGPRPSLLDTALQNVWWNNNGRFATVDKIKIIDDYSDPGGYDPDTYKGSIISKTQKYTNGSWSEKFKMKEFYLNWAERQDLWPVGPIDLRWDENRKVWTAADNSSKPYKFIYVTLEEDLVKEPDYDETYPTKAFIDDIEYSQEPLPNGYRRLVYVKDKAGYTAPKGTKLLCRYSIDNGFYEPISKPVIVAKGIIASTNTATIEMHYVQGRKAGNIPKSLITFDNPLGFNAVTNDRGIFTYINGLWTLTSKR